MPSPYEEEAPYVRPRPSASLREAKRLVAELERSRRELRETWLETRRLRLESQSLRARSGRWAGGADTPWPAC